MKTVTATVAVLALYPTVLNAESPPLDEKMASLATTVIQNAGYHCPRAKAGFELPPDTHGKPWEIVCGRLGDDTVDNELTFRMTLRAKGGWLVAPAPSRY